MSQPVMRTGISVLRYLARTVVFQCGWDFQEARGEFDDHGIFFGAADFADESHVGVGFRSQRKFAVGTLLIAVLRLHGHNVADSAHGHAFDLGNIREMGGCPIGAKFYIGGERQIVDDGPVHVMDIGFRGDVGAVFSDKGVGIGVVAIPRAGAVGAGEGGFVGRRLIPGFGNCGSRCRSASDRGKRVDGRADRRTYLVETQP